MDRALVWVTRFDKVLLKVFSFSRSFWFEIFENFGVEGEGFFSSTEDLQLGWPVCLREPCVMWIRECALDDSVEH